MKPNPYDPPVADSARVNQRDEPSTSNWLKKSLLGFSIAAACGFATWVLSPILTGQIEPWDSALFFASMFATGFVIGTSIRPTHMVSWLAAPAGMWFGQLLFVLISPSMRIPFWVAAIALAIYSLLFLPSYALATAYFLFRKKSITE